MSVPPHRLTAFNLIDVVHIAAAKPGKSVALPPGVRHRLPVNIIAAWVLTDREKLGRTFEVQFVLRTPGNKNPEGEIIAQGKVTFSRPVGLITVENTSFDNAYGLRSGILQVDGQLRRPGKESWIAKQSCRLYVADVTPPT
jgi:hypothetical protein